MNQISYDGEIQVPEIQDETKTYLKTPYYKTIPDISISGPVEGPQYNYSNYDKFCLLKNLEPVFSSLGFTFEIYSKKIENRMVLCVFPKLKNFLFEMSDKTQYQLQQEVDYACANLYHLCLVYHVFNDNTYPKTWLCNIFQNLEISKSLNPSFINGRLYFALDEFTDYDTTYSDAFDALMIQISQLYNTGALICSKTFAEKWDLVPYKNNIYIANWNDNRITKCKSLFLYNLSIDPITTIQVPKNLFFYHYISKIISLPVIDDDKMQLTLDSIEIMKNILELIDLTIDYTNPYSISTYSITCIDNSEDCKNKISKVYKTSDFSIYKDVKGQYILSVLIKGASLDLDRELKRILDL
jgi:hypothetical protein